MIYATWKKTGRLTKKSITVFLHWVETGKLPRTTATVSTQETLKLKNWNKPP